MMISGKYLKIKPSGQEMRGSSNSGATWSRNEALEQKWNYMVKKWDTLVNFFKIETPSRNKMLRKIFENLSCLIMKEGAKKWSCLVKKWDTQINFSKIELPTQEMKCSGKFFKKWATWANIESPGQKISHPGEFSKNWAIRLRNEMKKRE